METLKQKAFEKPDLLDICDGEYEEAGYCRCEEIQIFMWRLYRFIQYYPNYDKIDYKPFTIHLN